MPPEITLDPENLFVTGLEFEFPEDGSPGTGRATVAGDARPRASETGMALVIDGTEYGPLRGLGDYDFDPRTGHTTLYLAEQLPAPDPAPAVTASTVAGVLSELWPGIDLGELPLMLAAASVDGLEVQDRDRREVFGSLIGGLGYRLIQDGAAFSVGAPARADRLPDEDLLVRHISQRGDLTGVPSRIVVRGGSVGYFALSTGVGGPPASSGVEAANVRVSWSDLNGESVGRVKGWVIRHWLDGAQPADLATVKPTGAGSYSYAHVAPGPGLHWYDIVSLVATGPEKAVTLRRSDPGLSTSARPDALATPPSGQQGTVSVQPGVLSFSLTLPGEATQTRVTVTGPGGSATVDGVGRIEVGEGKAVGLTLAAGTAYAVTFTNPQGGAVTYPPLSVTTRPLPTMNPVATPTGRGVIVTWSGAGRYVLRITQAGATVQQVTVTGGQATITGLALATEYLAALYPEGDPGLAQGVTFTTLAEDLSPNEEELFALARNATHTKTTAVGGGTHTVIRTRAGGRLARVRTITETTAPYTTTDAESGAQFTQELTTISESDTVNEYGHAAFPEVETGSSTLTTNSGPSGTTTIRTRVAKTWNPHGWLNVLATNKAVTETPAGGTLRATGNEVQVDTWARDGLNGWSLTRKRTGKTLAPVFAADGTLTSWVELPISEEPVSATAQAPEFAPTPTDPAAPLELDAPAPPPAPVWEQEPEAAPETPEEGTVVEDDGAPTVQLSAVRAAPGFAAPLEVDLSWSGSQTLLEWAADHLLETAGSLRITNVREYPEPWGVRRGGAVLGVTLSLGDTFTERVTTRYTP